MELLNIIWNQVPQNQRKIIKRSKRRKKRDPKPSMTSSVSTKPSTSKISIEDIREWGSDIGKFLNEPVTSFESTGFSFPYSYKLRSMLAGRTERDIYRMRFLNVLFARLLMKVSSPQLKSANVKRAVGIIKGSSEKGDCATVIEENLMSWADIGRRLDTLCKDLNENNENNLGEDMHLGFLFRLPEYVTDRQ